MVLMLMTKKELLNSIMAQKVTNLEAITNTDEEKVNESKKKYNLGLETRPSSGFSGLALGATLHAQVR